MWKHSPIWGFVLPRFDPNFRIQAQIKAFRAGYKDRSSFSMSIVQGSAQLWRHSHQLQQV